MPSLLLSNRCVTPSGPFYQLTEMLSNEEFPFSSLSCGLASSDDDCRTTISKKAVGNHVIDRLFLTFGEARKLLATVGHAAITKRFSRSSKLALPYICRFSIFSLLFKPSTGPLLTSLIMLALTAA